MLVSFSSDGNFGQSPADSTHFKSLFIKNQSNSFLLLCCKNVKKNKKFICTLIQKKITTQFNQYKPKKGKVTFCIALLLSVSQVFASLSTKLCPAKLQCSPLQPAQQLSQNPLTSTSRTWDHATTQHAQTSTAWSLRTSDSHSKTRRSVEIAVGTSFFCFLHRVANYVSILYSVLLKSVCCFLFLHAIDDF